MESILSLAAIALVKLGQELNEKHWGKAGLIGLVGSGLITTAGFAGKKAGEARKDS